MLESLVRRDLHSWRLRRVTSSTNLMPICLHQSLDCSPLVLTKRWFLCLSTTRCIVQYCKGWFIFQNQFDGKGHLLYFVQLYVCRNLTFLANLYCRLHLSFYTTSTKLFLTHYWTFKNHALLPTLVHTHWVGVCGFVGEGEFASPKTPKSHITHESNAHLSTPTIADSFSSGIHQKVVFLFVHHKQLIIIILRKKPITFSF